MGSFQEGASFTIAIAFFFLFTKIPLLQFDMGYENNFFSFFFFFFWENVYICTLKKK